MWQGILRFTVGLLLVVVFASALFAAAAGTFIVAEDRITSIGDPELFEAKMRHYTDRLEVAADGTLHLVQVQHPVAQMVASIALAWLVALGSTGALR